MARKKDTPQKAALREMMGNYLKENNVKVKDGADVNSIMRDMMSIIVGLSNICYTVFHKFIQDSLWGFPSQRSHGKMIIIPSVIDLELLREVL